MTRRRLRTDLSNLISWTLLASAAVTIATGIIADAWDLNGFRLHTVAGYVMTVAALAHVALSWRRLTFYTRFRLRQLRRPRRRAAAGPTGSTVVLPAPSPTRATGVTGALVSRRGVLGMASVGAAGFLAGRGLRPAPAIAKGSDVGLVYHEWSKPGIVDALGTLTDWGGRPPQYKRYDTPRTALPARGAVTRPLGEAIQSRHSTREYDATPLPLDELSTLLAHTGGLRDGHDDRRVAPSSGALYPIEIYPIVHRVDGLAPGVYHYDVRRHALSLVRPGDVRAQVMRIGLDQDFLAGANVVLAFTLIFQRMRFKYRDRSYRYGLLEAGHIGQNAYLTATGMQLGACAVGAFHDDGLNALLEVDGEEEVAVYLLAAGRRAD